MTKDISTVLGLRSEFIVKRRGDDFARTVPLTTVAATEDAEAQWQASCGFHRRAVIRMLTEIISKQYDWFIGLARHREAVSWTERDFVVTEVDGVWLTFIGNPAEHVWLLIRISECQPDCPIDSGPYPAGVRPAEEEGAVVSCYGASSNMRGAIIDALVPALAEDSAAKRAARTRYALRASGVGRGPKPAAPLRFRLCLVGVVHKTGRIPVAPGDLLEFRIDRVTH